MNTYDHYAEAKRLVTLLHQDGLTSWVKGINSAIEEGSTGTEIFMMLRVQLKEFLLSDQGSAVATDCAKTLLEKLNIALQV